MKSTISCGHIPVILPLAMAAVLAVTSQAFAGGRVEVWNTGVSNGVTGMTYSGIGLSWEAGPFSWGFAGDLGVSEAAPVDLGMNGAFKTGLRIPNHGVELFMSSDFKLLASQVDAGNAGACTGQGVGFGIARTLYIGPMDLSLKGSLYPMISNNIVLTQGSGTSQSVISAPYRSTWSKIGIDAGIPLNQRVAITLSMGTFTESVPDQMAVAQHVTSTGYSTLENMRINPYTNTDFKVGTGLRVEF